MGRTGRRVLKTKNLPRGQFIRMISKQVGIPQYKVEEVLETFFYIVKQALLTGFKIKWREFGVFDTKARKGMPKRRYYNVAEDKFYEAEAAENYCLPVLRFSQNFVNELREKTLGFVIEDEEDKDEVGDNIEY